MNRIAFKILGTTGGLIALYLVLVNWMGAAAVLSTVGKTYVSAVKVLQGR